MEDEKVLFLFLSFFAFSPNGAELPIKLSVMIVFISKLPCKVFKLVHVAPFNLINCIKLESLH